MKLPELLALAVISLLVLQFVEYLKDCGKDKFAERLECALVSVCNKYVRE